MGRCKKIGLAAIVGIIGLGALAVRSLNDKGVAEEEVIPLATERRRTIDETALQELHNRFDIPQGNTAVIVDGFPRFGHSAYQVLVYDSSGDLVSHYSGFSTENSFNCAACHPETME
ncbi:MAG: hypothetical protein KJ600_01650 [Nanoarchaeota archaeon]|nr:hypothetical protein [Nanoarchaeota archaeon]